jgi:hypothetical protein
MMTTDLHLALRLRMSGAIPLLLLYAFLAWTGATLPFLTFLCFKAEMCNGIVRKAQKKQ